MEYGELSFCNIRRVRLGRYEFNAWYGAPALFAHQNQHQQPQQQHNTTEPVLEPVLACDADPQHALRPARSSAAVRQGVWLETLYVCPFCFRHTAQPAAMNIHITKCSMAHTLPGKVMYSHDGTVIRKVRGFKYPLMCQNMCSAAKLFLEHKSVFYCLTQYDFYIAYQTLDGIETPMGFFSRELGSWEGNNLSVLCVFPCYQRRGIGSILVRFSYRLSQYEQTISGPERPLSAFGQRCYLRHWATRIGQAVVFGPLNGQSHLTLRIISKATGFRTGDIVLALDHMGVLLLHKGSWAVDIERLRRWVVDNGVDQHTGQLAEQGLVLY